MLGVVLLHTHGYSIEHHDWFGRMLTFCVPGFVFISGYFGIKFTVWKLVRLYMTAIFGVCVVMAAVVLFTDQIHNIADYVRQVFEKLNACWFLHAYAVLMFFSPMLNAALEKKGWEIPFLFVTFGWAYLCDLISIRPYVFFVPSFGSYTPLTLCGIYVAARLFKIHNCENFLANWHVALLLPILLSLGAIGLNHYNSPSAFILAMAIFLLFKRMGEGIKMGKFGNLIAVVSPCMFGVYVMHDTVQSKEWSSHVGAILLSNGCNVYLSYFVCAGMVFVCCVLVELIRQHVFVKPAKRMWCALASK
jgi:hypothetical protein